ncbi:MAG: hypothetical protein ACE5KM_04585 [Planctomycetaceae bacterium]
MVCQRKLLAMTVVATAVLTTAIRAEEPAAGVVRISDRRAAVHRASRTVYRAQSPNAVLHTSWLEGGQPCRAEGCRDGCGTGNRHCWPIISYDIRYPANPLYFDGRDGRVYSAQGYGVPMAVPLAPNVEHAYNYGWGIPASRLTPISRPAGTRLCR